MELSEKPSRVKMGEGTAEGVQRRKATVVELVLLRGAFQFEIRVI